MCNLVIKLQVSYRFSLLNRSSPVQQQGGMQQPQQQQGVLPQPLGQQQAFMFPEEPHGPVQHQHAGQQTSDSSNEHTSFRQSQSQQASDSPDQHTTLLQGHSHAQSGMSHVQSAGEWRHYAHGLPDSQSHQQVPAHQHRSTSRQQHPCLSAADPFAQASSSWRSGNGALPVQEQVTQLHSQQHQSGSMRPSPLWGFAASGVHLRQAPFAAEQGPFAHAPTEAEHAGSRPDPTRRVECASPAISQFQQQQQSVPTTAAVRFTQS